MNELGKRIEEQWGPFRDAVRRLGEGALERPTPAGWTAKEMLGHVAFWEECTEPVITGMFRGEDISGWTFGSGYSSGDEWPGEDEHNAREAAWAAAQPVAAVLARLDAAHARSMEIVDSLRDDELSDETYLDYLENKTAHYREHLPELEALL